MAEFITKCPHCNAELDAQEDWVGMDVECPECQKTFTINFPKNEDNAPTFPPPSQQGNASETPSYADSTFIFICPQCDTMANLPVALKGTQYECKSCCETSIAEEAVEKKCPNCQKTVNINAKICKYCKKNISKDLKVSKVLNDSKKKLQSSLKLLNGVREKVNGKIDLRKGIFIASCVFFVSFLIVFSIASFSKNVVFRPCSYANGYPSTGSSGKSINTSSMFSTTVGESSYGTYQNSICIADNTSRSLDWQQWRMFDFRTFAEDYQSKDVLFNISYGLLGIAIFLLLVAAFLDKFFTNTAADADAQASE